MVAQVRLDQPVIRDPQARLALAEQAQQAQAEPAVQDQLAYRVQLDHLVDQPGHRVPQALPEQAA